MIPHYISYLLFMNPLIGLNSYHTTDHCTLFYSGSALRSCNRVYHTHLPTEQEVKEIQEKWCSIPFTWPVHEQDQETIDILVQRGLSYQYSFPAMMLELNTSSAYFHHDAIEIRAINRNDRTLIEQWVAIMAQSFNTNEHEFAKVMDSFFARVDESAIKLYIGFYEGKAIAIGMGLNHGDTGTLHWIGTLPLYRKKGFGTAITQRILDDMRKEKCTKALLLSSAEGRSIYERIGFQAVGVYRMYGNY